METEAEMVKKVEEEEHEEDVSSKRSGAATERPKLVLPKGTTIIELKEAYCELTGIKSELMDESADVLVKIPWWKERGFSMSLLVGILFTGYFLGQISLMLSLIIIVASFFFYPQQIVIKKTLFPQSQDGDNTGNLEIEGEILSVCPYNRSDIPSEINTIKDDGEIVRFWSGYKCENFPLKAGDRAKVFLARIVEGKGWFLRLRSLQKVVNTKNRNKL